MTIKNYKLESSNLDSVLFDAEGSEIQDIKIHFNSGLVYKYFNVPIEICEEILLADSAGKYFNSKIKGHYDFKKEG